MVNVFIAVGVLASLGFVVWVIWMYHHSGRLREASGIVSAIAMIASLPLGAKLISERTSLISSAATDPVVVQVQSERVSADEEVLYVTLSDAAFMYLELPEEKYNKEVILSQGRVDPRIAHSFIVKNPAGVKLSLKLYVNGKLDMKTAELN